MKRFGLVRTSTNKQHIDRQVNRLKLCCDEVFIESGVSGKSQDRPVLDSVIAKLTTGDELVVVAYDRAFRCVLTGLIALDLLTEHGVKFISLTQTIDPTTAIGRFFFTCILAIAELEVGMLKERTIDGLKAAVARGSILGRPKKGEVRPKKRKRRKQAK